MRIWILCFLLTQLARPTAVSAQLDSNEEIFTSLTRRETPLHQLPANITVLTSAEIKASGAKSLDEVLDQVVSANVSRSGSLGTFSTIRLRGVPNSAQVQIVVDDQPFGGFSVDQNVDLSQIAVDNIERIEIVRGGSSVLYGANTTGGVVHIITKQYTRPGPAADFAFERQSFDTQIYRGQVGVKGDHFDGLAVVSRYQTDGFQTNSDATNLNGSINMGYSFENGGRFAVQIAQVSSESGVPQGTSVPISEWNGHVEREAVNPTKRSRNDRAESRIRFISPAMRMGQIQSVIYGSKSDYHSFNSAGLYDPDFQQASHIWGGDFRFLGNKGWTGGLSYERDENRNSYYSLQHVTNWGTYLQHEWGQKSFTFIPALRFDHNGNFGGELNPRLTAIGHVANWWSVSGNVARSFRAPSFFDLFYDMPPTYYSNRNLKPEIAWTYDAGNEWRVGKTTRIKVVGFFTEINDRIAGINTNNGPYNNTNGNITRAELSGTEVEFSQSTKFINHSVNYTFQRAKENSVGRSHFVDIAQTPRHMANWHIALHLPQEFAVENHVQFSSYRYQFDDHGGLKAPSYGLWNVRVSKRVHSADIYGGVKNITGERYSESFDYEPNFPYTATLNPMPDRTVYAGIGIHFGKDHSE